MLSKGLNKILNSFFTNLFLSCNQVPVIHKPRFQLLWDFYFNLHSIYEGLLLSRRGQMQEIKHKRKLFSIMFTHVNGMSETSIMQLQLQRTKTYYSLPVSAAQYYLTSETTNRKYHH